MNNRTAILLMAYGTPNSLDEVEPYYKDIRGGRKPTPENLGELKARYERVGGCTPLLDITREQAARLQERLGDGFKVYVGMKHWHPYIAEAIQGIAHDGLTDVIAIALAPHYSRFSIDGYIQRVRDAVSKGNYPLNVRFVESWNVNPLFLQTIAENLQVAREQFGVEGWDDIQVIFSAHSLPERILESKDPYPQQLLETCEAVAPMVRLPREQWRFAFQSAGRTGEKWLGPDILATLDHIAAEGKKRVLIAPIGFVADHLEVLYDIDVEAAERAQALGLEMRRIASPNAGETFIKALASLLPANHA